MASNETAGHSPTMTVHADRYPLNVTSTDLNSQRLALYHDRLNNGGFFEPDWSCLYLMDLARAGLESN